MWHTNVHFAMNGGTPSTGDDACRGWDSADCRGTPHCPPRCPRFVDKLGTPLLFLPLVDAHVDDGALLELYDCGNAGHSLSFPPYSTRESIAAWLDGIVERGRNVVALDGRRLVGHAVLTPSSVEEPEFGVFVDPGYRGRGLASELLRHAIAYAAADGYRGVVMSVSRENRAMRSIATAHGFEVVDTPDPDDWIGFFSYRLPLDWSPAVELSPRLSTSR